MNKVFLFNKHGSLAQEGTSRLNIEIRNNRVRVEGSGMFMGYLFLIGIILTLVLINYIVFKFSRQNKNTRIWSGLVLILITPIVFFGTMGILSPFDPGGFGTGLYSVLNTFLFFVNGITIIIIGLFTKNIKKTYE